MFAFIPPEFVLLFVVLRVHQCRFPAAPQHFLNLFPLPQGQGSLRPTFFCKVVATCRSWTARRYGSRYSKMATTASCPSRSHMPSPLHRRILCHGRSGCTSWSRTHVARFHGDACQGLMAFTPAASKGLVSRVATAKPLARATAAMKASAVSTAKPATRHLASSSA